MELRHLRYFVAVVEEGNLTTAARQRLYTAQPSLSRQIREMEDEVGAALLVRRARGVTATPAGQAFYEHAKMALAQVEAAGMAARRAAEPLKPTFALGFLTGQEMEWLPGAMGILRDELPRIDVTVSSQYSPDLADALVKGKLDLAFLRAEAGRPELAYQLVRKEPLVVLLPSDHPLARHKAISVKDLAGQTFVGVGHKATVLSAVINDYLKREGVQVAPHQVVDNLAMVISLVASTRGVALMASYAKNLLPWSVVSRPLKGAAPTVDLMVGYHKGNASPLLKTFLSRVGDMVAQTAQSAEATTG